MAVTIGVSMPPQRGDMAELRKAWMAADEMGADRIYTFDHFFVLPHGDPSVDPYGKSFEATAIQAAMAATVKRAEVSCLVHCVRYRNPNLLADVARTIDHICGGRFVLGLGSGWYELDFTEYGYEFGTVGWRLDRLAEEIVVIKDRLGRLNPPPLRRIPILIGGGGEKKTLRIVAEHADIWHAFGDLETLKRKMAILDDHCAALGRDPASIVRSTSVGMPGGPEPDQLVEIGFTDFVVHARGPQWPLDGLEKLLEWRAKHA